MPWWRFAHDPAMRDAVSIHRRDPDPVRPDRPDWSVGRRASKITIPKRANPLAKLVFAEMQRQRVSYAELEWRSGVLVSTAKAWRQQNRPGLASIEAALGALGWALVPVPAVEHLPDEARAELNKFADRFGGQQAALGAAIRARADFPACAKRDLENLKKDREK